MMLEIQMKGRKWKIDILRELEIEEIQYMKGLDEPACSRYCQKIERCMGCDPYKMKKSEFSHNLTDLLSVEAADITNDLILQTSYYTASQMKAYLILEAYNYLFQLVQPT